MGAQVYNQMMRLHQSPAPPRMKMSMRPAPSRVNRAKCNLFGGKVESTSLKQYVEQQIKEHNEAKSKKWGFDFQSERPLDNGTFDWKRVPTAVTPVGPTMITLTNAAHVIPGSQRGYPIRRSNSSSSSTSADLTMEELMDDRAKRANDRGDAVENALDDSLSSTTSTLSPAASTNTASEESEPETVDTYPTMRNRDRIIRKLRRESPLRTRPASPPKLRQPQITEYLKERKRLMPSPVERISAKKMSGVSYGALNGIAPTGPLKQGNNMSESVDLSLDMCLAV